MREAPLWILSDDRLKWLIENKRDAKHFLDILGVILQWTQPSRSERIWDMMQRSPPNEDKKQAELLTFESALDAQDHNGKFRSNISDDEYKIHEHLLQLIRGQKIDVMALGIQP